MTNEIIGRQKSAPKSICKNCGCKLIQLQLAIKNDGKWKGWRHFKDDLFTKIKMYPNIGDISFQCWCGCNNPEPEEEMEK